MKWSKVALGEVAQIVGGGTPRRDEPKYWGLGHYWVTPTDLPMPGDGILDLRETRETITDAGLHSSSANLLPVGSVLYSTRATIGKLAIACIPVATNQGFNNFIVGAAIYNRFLAYALQYFTPDITQLAGSTTFKEVSRSSLRSFKIPLPPISEQHRITELLDQADRLRKLRRKADAKASRILPALFLKMFGDPATNPKGWPVKKIRDLILPVSRRNPTQRPNQTFQYLDIAGIDGRLGVVTSSRTLFGKEAPGRARQEIAWHDVVVSTVRPYLRATALIPKELDGEIASTGLCVLRAQHPFGFGWLYSLTRQTWFTEQLNIRARGASYPAVTDADICDLLVPAPNNEITLSAFNAQFQIFDRINLHIADTAVKIEQLFQLLLQRVFSGQLTAKWREAHMKELLVEMEQQARLLNLPMPDDVEVV